MAAPAMTDKQKEVLKQLLSGGDITLKEAIEGSGFLPEAIGLFCGISGRDLRDRMNAGDKVKDLPATWKMKLRMAALKLGVTTAVGG